MGKCTERLYNGIVKENPTFVQMLGMCPTLAVTSSAINGAGMGLSTTCILVLSNAFISLFRKVIPDKVRIPSYIVIIASFVTVIQFLMQAYLPSLNDSLGIYIPLIVVNCIILGRAESYASKNKVLPSIFDGLGMGLGFTIGLTLIGMFRELIGKGCVFGFQIIGDGNLLQKTSGAGKAIGDVLAAYTPITIFVLAPGAFFVLAFIIATINKRNAKKAAKALAIGEEIPASCKPESCMGCANIMCAGRKAAMQDTQVNVQTNAGKASAAQTPSAPAPQPKKGCDPRQDSKETGRAGKRTTSAVGTISAAAGSRATSTSRTAGCCSEYTAATDSSFIRDYDYSGFTGAANTGSTGSTTRAAAGTGKASVNRTADSGSGGKRDV